MLMSKRPVLCLCLRRILQFRRRPFVVLELVSWMLHCRDVLVLLTVATSVAYLLGVCKM
jgi:hypothetical protein